MSLRVNDRVRVTRSHVLWQPGDVGIVAAPPDADGDVVVAFELAALDPDGERELGRATWPLEWPDPDVSPDYAGDAGELAWIPACKLEVSDG